MAKVYEIPKRITISMETGKTIECEMVQVTKQQLRNFLDPMAKMLAKDLVTKIRKGQANE